MSGRRAGLQVPAIRRLSRPVGVTGLLCMLIAGVPAAAQTLTSSFSSTRPALGTVVLDATRSSTFSISTTGLVSAPSTSGITVDATNPLRLVFSCSGGSSGSRSCRNETASVVLATASAPDGITQEFRCSNSSAGGVTVTCPTSAADPYTLTIRSNNNVNHQSWSVTVPIAVDVSYASDAARGNGSVTIGCSNAGSSTCGNSPAITFKSVRAMAVNTSADLDFGTLVLPATGSGTVTIATSGARSVTGNVTALPASSVSRARFMVTGEGQQLINVSVPDTITLRSGGDTLTVTTIDNLAGGSAFQVLGGSLGGSASLGIDVGGSITLDQGTPAGTYAGSFTVTASYQ